MGGERAIPKRGSWPTIRDISPLHSDPFADKPLRVRAGPMSGTCESHRRSPPGAFYCEDAAGGLWCSTLDGKLWRVMDDRFELLSAETDCAAGRSIGWRLIYRSASGWGRKRRSPPGMADGFADESRWRPRSGCRLLLFHLQDGGALVAADGRVRKYLDRRWVSEFRNRPDLANEQMLQQSLFRDREGGLWQISARHGDHSYRRG